MSLPTCPSCVYATHKCKKTGVTIGRTTGCTYHEPKPQTNADRIRAMTDEELAMLLGAPTIVSPPWCDMNYDCPYADKDPARCDLCSLDWLKQPAEEEGGSDELEK